MKRVKWVGKVKGGDKDFMKIVVVNVVGCYINGEVSGGGIEFDFFWNISEGVIIFVVVELIGIDVISEVVVFVVVVIVVEESYFIIDVVEVVEVVFYF